MDEPSLAKLAESLRAESLRLGFALVGIAPAVEPIGYGQLQRWLESGYAGEMNYFERRREAYSHPRHVLDGVRSLVLLGLDYNTGLEGRSEPGQGRVSRYAWGSVDYHDLIWGKLDALQEWLAEKAPGASSRGVVDTAPLLEREFAQLAGLGWRGKNTLLINPQRGSYFFLAALLTDLSLPCDPVFTADHCGTCRRCLDACPTGAFPEPYLLDATKCISYLTIELRSEVPESLRPGLGDWLLGCDICQEVCPWNRFTRIADEPGFLPRQDAGLEDLETLLGLSEGEFRARFRNTPLWRPRRRGILRNAAIILGNQRHVPALKALCRALQDEEELIRGAAAWALGQLGGEQARAALRARLPQESATQVRTEIERALEAASAEIAE
jgi:epoxyqueuosine reductase